METVADRVLLATEGKDDKAQVVNAEDIRVNRA